MIGEALYEHLAADPLVASYVGDRIYPGIAPEAATYPLIQYIQVGGQRLPVLNGRHTTKGPRLQLDMYVDRGDGWSGHMDRARSIAAAVEAAMETFRGIHGDTEVLSCVLDYENEIVELDGQLARVVQHYEVWWRSQGG